MSIHRGWSIGGSNACIAALAALLLATLGCENINLRSRRTIDTPGEDSRQVLARMETVRSTPWRIVRLQRQEVPEGSPDFTDDMNGRLTLTLQPDGRATGSTGVNHFAGTYKITAPDSLRLSQIVSTKRAGSSEAMQREAQLLNALDRVRFFVLEEQGDRPGLQLLDAHRKVLIDATPAHP